MDENDEVKSGTKVFKMMKMMKIVVQCQSEVFICFLKLFPDVLKPETQRHFLQRGLAAQPPPIQNPPPV